MKAERVIVLIGTGLTGILCLALAVVCAATAISATSASTAWLFGSLAVLETVAVANTAYQMAKAIIEWWF